MKPAPVQNSSSVACNSYRFPPDFTEVLLSAFRTRLSVVLAAMFICHFSYGQAKDSTITEDTAGSNHEMRMTPEQVKKILTPKQKRQRQFLITGANVAVYGGSLIALNNAWYKDYKKTSFHTFNDSKEWLQMDKIGHAWGAYTGARGSTGLWTWTGLPHQKAVWLGGLSSFAYLTTIEFFDAYSAKWGWSWSDIGANIIGSGLFMGQEFLWKEQRIQFKFSFHTNSYRDQQLRQRADDLFGKPWYERMLKDYNAQTYWLSGNIKSFFPESNWPVWLNAAVGYGADGMFGGFENKWQADVGDAVTRDDIPRKRQFYLAPDFDFTKIKTKSKLLKTTFTFLNAFKFPTPALMIDSKGKFKAYALYF
jgi:Predicted periplasmic lipoprotein (DUF2279)